MRKIFCLLLLLMLTAACKEPPAKTDSTLADNKIYFFYYNECPYCHDALDYLTQKYPNLKVTMVNIHNPGGYELLLRCAKKFKLGNNVGTPLFCMGDRYLMGWSPQSPRQFDRYVQPFLN